MEPNTLLTEYQLRPAFDGIQCLTISALIASRNRIPVIVLPVLGTGKNRKARSKFDVEAIALVDVHIAVRNARPHPRSNIQMERWMEESHREFGSGNGDE